MNRFIVLIMLLLIGKSGSAQITSTFDTDADGWTFFDGSTPIIVDHNPANGNPDGFVSVTYSSSTTATTESWFAPSKFLGNLLVRSLGRDFKFDLQQSIVGTGSSSSIAEIRIERSGNVLVYQLPAGAKPAVAPAWSSYSIKLDETGGWLWSSSTGSPATRSQIINVLSYVTSIEIRGTYGSNASYTSGLDNVVVEQNTLMPAPAVSSLSALTGKAGDAITINGTGFDPSPSNNAVMFTGAAAVVTSASATQLTVTVPAGVQYGNVTVINKVTGLSSVSSTPFVPTFTGGGRIIPASFKPKVDFTLDATLGNDLNGLAVADLDGDGWNDVIAVESTPASISIFQNLGTGGALSVASFSSKITLAGAGGSGLFVVDLDNDGKFDIAATNGSSFITFRNTSTSGNISFDTSEAWGMAASGFLAEAVDVDGDGRIDLIGQHGNGSVTVDFWIAQNISTPGNIEFGSSVSYFGGSLLDAGDGVQSGDLNNDGKPDLLVEHGFGNTFSIIQNNSTPGVISLETPLAMGEPVGGGIQVADVNLDGKNDLIWKRGSSNDDVRIRVNTHTSGSFTTDDFATQIILDSELLNFGGTSLGDFNGDGKPDIMASDSRQFGIFENQFEGGVFTSSSMVSAFIIEASGVSTYPYTPLAADLNGDQKPEIILGVTNTSPVRFLIYENVNVAGPQISVNTVSPLSGPIGSTVTITGSNFSPAAANNHVYFGAVKATVLTASPTELTVTVPPGASYAPVSVRVGELTSRYRLPFVTTFSAGVNFNNTHFAPPVSFTLTNANYDIEVGDLNLDGKPDILAEANGGFAFRNTHTSGSISSASLLPDDTLSVSSFINPRLEDFDGDGLLDVASVNGLAHRNASTASEISFEPSVGIGLGASNMDLADFNNDGKIDFAVTADLSGTGDLVVRENRSVAGVFTTGAYGTFSSNIIFNKPAAVGGIITEDLDGDGFADVATTNPDSDNISVYLNAGVKKISTAQFASRLDLTVGDNPGRIYKGDFNSDGKLDLLLYHSSTGANPTLLTVFQNTSTPGNLSFTRIDLTNPSATTVATVADLDGDGKPEILTVSETGNRFSIFKNIHSGGALTAASFAAPFNTTVTAPRGITTGDLNLDGRPEIILTRAAGLLVVYENLTTLASVQNFITRWNLATAGSGATQLSFGTATSGVVNYAWQEISPGTASGGGSWSGTTLTITGLPAGATIRLQIAPTNFQRINVRSGVDEDRLMQVEQWGTTTWTTMQNAFGTCTNLQITATDVPNLSGVTDMSSMFESCRNLNSPSNIGTWNTSTVTNMRFMFYDATAFNQDIGAWNTAAVTDMNTMFSEALAFNQNIGSWNTAAVTDMSDMFGYNTAFNQDISGWNTGAVTDMSFMFRGATAFNQNISSWNTAAVTDMRSMFRDANAFNQNLGAWTLSAGVNISLMLDNSGVNCTNYSATLIGWSANPSTPTGRTLGAAGRQYGTNAVAARSNLTATKGWIITGDAPSGTNCSVLLPTIASFTPASGPIGITVIINGTNFSTTPANNIVFFGATKATVTAATSTQLTVTVPVGATYHPISIAVDGLTAQSRLPFTTTFSGAALQPCSFAPKVNFGTSNFPSSIQISDLNGDGNSDLVSSNKNSNTISVLLADGNGGFGAKTDYATGVFPLHLAIGDLNSDGKPDLVVANDNPSSPPNYISVLLGNGNGTFGSKTDYLVGVSPQSLALGDLNLDGKLDVVVANSNETTVSVLLGTGNGGLAPKTNYTVNLGTTDITVMDANKDGKPDIVVANFFSNTVSLLLGNGLGNLGPKTDFGTGAGPVILSVADLNDDTNTDLVIANYNANTISVLLGNGTGGFAPKVDYATGAKPSRVAVGDLNGDGVLDVSAVNESSNTVSVFQGSASGTLSPKIDFPTGASPRGLSIGDINADNRPDLVITNSLDNTVSVLNNLVGITPTITGFAPLFGAVGTAVTITGTNFNTMPANNIVNFNGVAATVTASTITSISTTVPVGATTGTLSITTGCATVTSASNFTVTASPVITITAQPTTASVCEGITASFTTAATGATNLTYQWQFSSTFAGTYTDINNGGGYTNATTATLAVNTTSGFGEGFYRCAVNGDFAVTVYSSPAELVVTPVPAAPGATGDASCPGNAQTLTATGAMDGNYRWYTVASGGTAISGQTSSTYTTPALSTTTTYHVSINDGTCESARTPVVATVLGPAAPTVTDAERCDAGSVVLTAMGGTAGNYRWYTVTSGGTALPGETNETFTTPALTTTTTYYVAVDDGTCESARSAVTATISIPPAPPTATSNFTCGGGTVTLTASGTTDGNYRWYTFATGGTALPGETNASYTTPTLSTNTMYYVSINDGVCESPRTTVTAEVLTPPIPPNANDVLRCEAGTVTLTATGGTDGQYRWYVTATGGSPDASQLNSSFTTGALSTSTLFYVALNDGACESARTEVEAAIEVLQPPVVTASITPAGQTIILCEGETVTLSAPAGFAVYGWSNGATTQQVTLNEAGSYFVTAETSTGCISPPSVLWEVIVNTCTTNQPPLISATSAATEIEGTTVINLLALVSDPDNNADISTLRIVEPPLSGAAASIDASGNLTIDYAGIAFSGQDRLTIEVCDSEGICVRQQLFIEVTGDIVVMNGLSPNGDNANDFFQIKYIDALESTRQNRVTIFNRWGDAVFEATNYNNRDNVFTGQNKNGNELPSGTYLYRIEFSGGRSPLTGYLVLKR